MTEELQKAVERMQGAAKAADQTRRSARLAEETFRHAEYSMNTAWQTHRDAEEAFRLASYEVEKLMGFDRGFPAGMPYAQSVSAPVSSRGAV